VSHALGHQQRTDFARLQKQKNGAVAPPLRSYAPRWGDSHQAEAASRSSTRANVLTPVRSCRGALDLSIDQARARNSIAPRRADAALLGAFSGRGGAPCG